MKDTTVRRAEIQNVLGPAIEKATLDIEGLDLSKPEHQRRYARAVVRSIAQELLPRGMDPHELLSACAEAIGREVEQSMPLPDMGTVPQDFSLN